MKLDDIADHSHLMNFMSRPPSPIASECDGAKRQLSPTDSL